MTENTQLYEHAEKISHFSKFLEDLVAGSCCGVAICLSSHPFDTVKVRMQIHGSGKLYNEIMKIFRAEGPLAFYQGMSYPLYTQPLVNAIVFAAYEFFKRFTKIAEDQELNLK
jgi:solute carrier family 25 carnitine/acylcarnitine transporter 20/29